MPYYVFKIRPFGQLEPLAEAAVYKDAAARAKALRAELEPGGDADIKLIFAGNEDEAVELLCQTRTPGPSGDE